MQPSSRKFIPNTTLNNKVKNICHCWKIGKSHPPSSIAAVIYGIISLSHGFWKFAISHTRRNENHPTHLLAKHTQRYWVLCYLDWREPLFHRICSFKCCYFFNSIYWSSSFLFKKKKESKTHIWYIFTRKGTLWLTMCIWIG